tara:strand:- start:3288 stop:3605 length:318 start_codon:yes stop_codon:yes gene_type:complete
MDQRTLDGLVVLEYLRLGLVPFFPNKKTQPLNEVIHKEDRNTKRKFRKQWRKASKKYCSHIPKKNFNNLYGAKNANPSPIQMKNRKWIVWRYIRDKVAYDQRRSK